MLKYVSLTSGSSLDSFLSSSISSCARSCWPRPLSQLAHCHDGPDSGGIATGTSVSCPQAGLNSPCGSSGRIHNNTTGTWTRPCYRTHRTFDNPRKTIGHLWPVARRVQDLPTYRTGARMLHNRNKHSTSPLHPDDSLPPYRDTRSRWATHRESEISRHFVVVPLRLLIALPKVSRHILILF